MTEINILPTDLLERLERWIENLETTVLRLARVIETQSKNKRDAFQELFTGKEFAQHLKDTVTLFRQDPAQFVDPFTTYRE